jgi:ABC-type transporter lipoprotein component MlaA
MRFLAALLIAWLAAGCTAMTDRADAYDPWEGMNRKTFAFNDAIDRAVLKPVAQGYQKVTPGFVREGVNNFFGNLEDVGTGLNNFLQGKFAEGVSDTGRIVVNTVLGVFGLWDVATPMGLEKHDEDFGQTLGAWGVNPGPYFVIPLLGPSTVRDAPREIRRSPVVLAEVHRQRHALLEHLRIGQGAPARQPAESGDGARRSLDRPLQLPSRCVVAAAPQPGVRRKSPAREGRRGRSPEKIAAARQSIEGARMTLGVKLLVVFFAFLAILVTVIAVAFRERTRGKDIAADDIAAQQQQDARVMAVIFSAIMGGMLLTLIVAWLVFF